MAAIVTSESDFFARLAHAGVRVKLRRSSGDPQQVTEYAVGLDGAHHRIRGGRDGP